MAPVFGVWHPVEWKLLRRVHDRLANTGGCLSVRYEPSRRDANEVVAEVDPVAFLGRDYSSEEAHLRVEFDLTGDRPHSWIHWWEPTASRGIGWHVDETEPAHGPAHLQVDRPDGTTDRRPADQAADEHPYRTFERRLAAITRELETLGWD